MARKSKQQLAESIISKKCVFKKPDVKVKEGIHTIVHTILEDNQIKCRVISDIHHDPYGIGLVVPYNEIKIVDE